MVEWEKAGREGKGRGEASKHCSEFDSGDT